MGGATPPNAKLRYIPQLDGLRAIAIALVLLHHIFTSWVWKAAPPGLLALARHGTVGVDVFFVLSGFLITTILLRSEPGASTLRRFYFRRVLRIWPLYYSLLAVKAIEVWWHHTHYPFLLCVFFLQNFLPAWPLNPNFNQSWSLCVEEHFYLVWPLLVLFLPRRLLPFVAAMVVALSPLVRAIGLHAGADLKQLYTFTQYRLDGIAIGSLLALLVSAGLLESGILRRLGWLLFLTFLPAAIWLVTAFAQLAPARVIFGDSLFALGFAGLLCLTLASRFFIRPLSIRPLRYIGRISYGLYLIHPFVFGFVSLHILGLKGIVVGLLLSFGAAALSWKWMERPILAFAHSASGSSRPPAAVPVPAVTLSEPAPVTK